jgi:hypothetical protein
MVQVMAVYLDSRLMVMGSLTVLTQTQALDKSHRESPGRSNFFSSRFLFSRVKLRIFCGAMCVKREIVECRLRTRCGEYRKGPTLLGRSIGTSIQLRQESRHGHRRQVMYRVWSRRQYLTPLRATPRCLRPS